MKRNTTTGGPSRAEQYARLTLIAVLMLSLVVVLATRFTASVPTSATVHAGSGKAAQRMNQNSARWFVPILQIALLVLPESRFPSAVTNQFVANSFCEQSLHNRPPPVF